MSSKVQKANRKFARQNGNPGKSLMGVLNGSVIYLDGSYKRMVKDLKKLKRLKRSKRIGAAVDLVDKMITTNSFRSE